MPVDQRGVGTAYRLNGRHITTDFRDVSALVESFHHLWDERLVISDVEIGPARLVLSQTLLETLEGLSHEDAAAFVGVLLAGSRVSG